MKQDLGTAVIAVIFSACSVLFAGCGGSGPTDITKAAKEDSTAVFPEATNGTFDPVAPAPRSSPPTQPVRPPPENSGPLTNMAFNAATHNFGYVDQNSENKFTFVFTNTGTHPLLIDNAIGSCGCTIPEYPKQPIAPGEKGEINVVYKSGLQIGLQNKTITVMANTDLSPVTLRITANVKKP